MLQRLVATDTGHRGPRIDCGKEHLAEFVGYRDKQVDTVLGRITVRRAWYHCAECEHGIAPRDDDLGVAGASLSPGLRSMTARAAAAEPFAAAADLLAELSGIRLSAKRIERSAETDGAAVAERLTAESAAVTRREVAVLPASGRPRRAKPPDKLYIAIDGTGVPMVAAAVADRAGKRRRRPGPHPRSQTRLPVYPNHRGRAGPPGARPRLHQLPGQLRPRQPSSPPWCTPKPAAAAPTTSANSSCSATERPGSGSWPPRSLPEATPIVDIYHAREHLHDLAAALAPALGNQHRDWLTARLADLDAGDIETLVTETTRSSPLTGDLARDTEKALAYFKTNAHRMRYAYFRDHGMFVGSGTVEAGCKAVIGQRLKLSGMRWNIPGATGTNITDAETVGAVA